MDSCPECFGKIFPNLDHLQYNQHCKGKVFSVIVESKGLGHTSKRIEVNESEWTACRECKYVDSCHELCKAKLMLRHAVTHIT